MAFVKRAHGGDEADSEPGAARGRLARLGERRMVSENLHGESSIRTHPALRATLPGREGSI